MNRSLLSPSRFEGSGGEGKGGKGRREVGEVERGALTFWKRRLLRMFLGVGEGFRGSVGFVQVGVWDRSCTIRISILLFSLYYSKRR